MKARLMATTALLVGIVIGGTAAQLLHAESKAPVYFVAENDISNTDGYLKEYAPRAREMITANGGRYVAAGEATTFVGEPPKSRVAIFVFDNMEQIRTWLNSSEYGELRKVGERHAKFRNYAVSGLVR
jgi:uncharacterized protein (DUF1330 family)